MEGKRDAIDSRAARKIERAVEKPEGWMDTDFELWPFPDKALLEQIEGLKLDHRLEIQGAMRQALAALAATQHSSGKFQESRHVA
jgi:hypothetical protein